MQDITALAEGLARFHEAGRHFPERFDKLGLRGETDPADMLERSRILAQECPGCAQAVLPYQEWLAWAGGVLPDSAFEALPATVAHGDIQPANIIMGQGHVAAFVDLDWCAWRPRIYDLGFALLFCCAAHDAPIDGSDIWSLTQPPRLEKRVLQAFLRRYEEHAFPLSGAEREALPAQVALRWCHTRIMGAFKVPIEKRAAFLSRPPHDLRQLISDAFA